jgi:hypothetical protein
VNRAIHQATILGAKRLANKKKVDKAAEVKSTAWEDSVSRASNMVTAIAKTAIVRSISRAAATWLLDGASVIAMGPND